MQAKFIGVPGEEHDSIFMYGQDFPKGKSVTINTAFAQRKLHGHPHFQVTGEANDAEDAVIKDEFAKAADVFLKSEQDRLEAEQAAEVLQAKKNAAADEAVEAARHDTIETAIEFQKAVETPAIPVTADGTVIETALEFQKMTEGAPYGNGNGLGDSGSKEVEQSGSGGNRKRGRPATSK